MKRQRNRHSSAERLREARDLERLLTGEMHRVLEEPATERARMALLLILDRLRVNLPRQMVAADRPEYMWEVLDGCPHLQRRVETLHRRNLRTFSVLAGVSDRVARVRPFVAIAADVRGALKLWMQSRERLRRDEGRLLQLALSFEVGGEA